MNHFDAVSNLVPADRKGAKESLENMGHLHSFARKPELTLSRLVLLILGEGSGPHTQPCDVR